MGPGYNEIRPQKIRYSKFVRTFALFFGCGAVAVTSGLTIGADGGGILSLSSFSEGFTEDCLTPAAPDGQKGDVVRGDEGLEPASSFFNLSVA